MISVRITHLRIPPGASCGWVALLLFLREPAVLRHPQPVLDVAVVGDPRQLLPRQPHVHGLLEVGVALAPHHL